MKKQMTIEDLAVITQKEFRTVNARLGDMEDKFDKRFEEVDRRFDGIENILLRAHDNRIERIEDSIRVIKTALKMR